MAVAALVTGVANGIEDGLGVKVVRPSRIPTAAEARAYLESLPDLWAKTSDAGRHAIAEAVFERIDVLGANDFTFALTSQARARGWDAVFGPSVVRVKEGQSGRGERSSADTFQLNVRVVGGSSDSARVDRSA